MISRRQFIQSAAIATAVAPSIVSAAGKESFRLRYLLSSAMYGEMPLETILPELAKTNSEGLDIWCKPHGNQREQATEKGDEAFQALLAKHKVKLTVSTRYPLGPMKLKEEMAWVKKMGGKLLVCGSSAPSEPEGEAAKVAAKKFIEEMKPHTALAEELGLTIAVENHDKQFLYHPDALRYFAEFNKSPGLGVAFAFHHLYKWENQIPALLRDLGNKQIPFIYFQEHSDGIRAKAPKEIEMKQMPGFGGKLDYREIVRALRDIKYSGFVEIFMHPTPRGIPILPTADEVTGAINRSRNYIENCLKEIS